MDIKVDAMPPDQFASWQQATLAQATGTGGGAGKALYDRNCASCHQAAGQGLEGAIPPLAGSEVPNGPPEEHVRVVLHGLQGPLTVKGKQYNGVMPPFAHLTDDEIAAIISYERTQWGNRGGPVTAAQVRSLRGR
jgi:mono/diheme cytochrome c family protein